MIPMDLQSHNAAVQVVWVEKTGLYLIDMNYPPTLTEKARCITARQDSGVSKHKGEHSAVFCDLNENPQITENARCLHTRYRKRIHGI